MHSESVPKVTVAKFPPWPFTILHVFTCNACLFLGYDFHLKTETADFFLYFCVYAASVVFSCWLHWITPPTQCGLIESWLPSRS